MTRAGILEMVGRLTSGIDARYDGGDMDIVIEIKEGSSGRRQCSERSRTIKSMRCDLVRRVLLVPRVE